MVMIMDKYSRINANWGIYTFPALKGPASQSTEVREKTYIKLVNGN